MALKRGGRYLPSPTFTAILDKWLNHYRQQNSLGRLDDAISELEIQASVGRSVIQKCRGTPSPVNPDYFLRIAAAIGVTPEVWVHYTITQAEVEEDTPSHMIPISESVTRDVRRVLCREQRLTGFFYGRRDILEGLKAFFTGTNGAGRRKVAAVTGFGGEGKTSIALRYAYENKEEYKYAFFVRVDGIDGVTEAYADILAVIAEDTAIPDKTRTTYQQALAAYGADKREAGWVTRALKEWMQTAEQFLIVFDNADFCNAEVREKVSKSLIDASISLTEREQELARGIEGQMTEDEFAEFLPEESKGHFLLTSRISKFTSRLTNVRCFYLEYQSWDAAEEFLVARGTAGVVAGLKVLAQGEKTAVENIVTTLGRLPLALEQAGAFIHTSTRYETDRKGRFEWYNAALERTKQRQGHTMEIVEGGTPTEGDYHSSVALTYDISREAIRAEQHAGMSTGEAALCALSLYSFLNPDDLFPELLTGAVNTVSTNAEGLPTDAEDLLLPLFRLFVACQALSAEDTEAEEVGKAIAATNAPLQRYSLLEFDTVGWTYRMHRVLQDVVRSKMNADERKNWTVRSLGVLDGIWNALPETNNAA
jgi:hypothetical protein